MVPQLLLRNNVEVVSINPVTKTFALTVTLQVSPLQLYSTFIQKEIAKRVRFAVKYLEAEGFVPDVKKENWHIIITGIAKQ